ncbi:exodeoxyribonuclease VII small subunit [Kushneria marisflavi]|uniref:Exodeoxyribonuclease 7 small subunit n=1 Tax=Kushneria marisflavi TaxID=157779 RepID=A0A240UNA4_9GAMM|nr:exodeoxyribonuclease VII small subunit [Kushneria marisflavi]ART62974.1 exodeoxyribonuclease VII small subunit [Kushneria marisflavi]RKD84795.1 exodeoxyribonuclease VII small subunit [Kushneria marisflavi]
MTQRPESAHLNDQAAAASSTPAAQTPSDFAGTLAALEGLVRRLESGDSGLEASLEDFERGIALVRDARARLEQAELRVQQLLEQDDGALVSPPLNEQSHDNDA